MAHYASLRRLPDGLEFSMNSDEERKEATTLHVEPRDAALSGPPGACEPCSTARRYLRLNFVKIVTFVPASTVRFAAGL